MFIEFQIDSEQYLGLVDTGSALSMLRKDVLSKIPTKTYVSNSEYISINGGKYLTPNFNIPEVKIGTRFTEAVFKEEDERFWTEGCVIGYNWFFIPSLKIYLMHQVFRDGVIGVDLFQNFACVFDFPHSSIFLADHISEIIDESTFIPILSELGKAGVILKLETDLGTKRFLLDSAASFSLIKLSGEENAHAWDGHITLKLTNDDTDLGFWDFRVLDFPEEIDDMDGILGIDFFKKSIIGLDFEAKITYIQFPKLGSKERFTYWLKSYFGK